MEPVDVQPTLRDLAAVARRDGGDAAEALLGRVRQLALRYARARLGRFGAEDVAQDVAQEVCMAVHTGLRTYDDRGLPFEAFVYSIAAHKVADAQRTFSRGAVLIDEIPDQAEPSPTPEERVIAAVDRSVANQLLGRLPHRMREVLLLRAGGMSAEVIGQRLGMSANAVRVTQHRASNKLRTLIEQSEERREIFDTLLSADLQLVAG
jgi:RNA polymerase sigma-70 factor (ECF subfamily)